MTRRRLILVWALPILAVLAFAGFVVGYELRQPPLERLQMAMDALQSARQSQAESLASDTFRQAQKNLESGQQAIRRVNADWWPFVSYRQADSLLLESIRLSGVAVSLANKKRKQHRVDVETEITQLTDSLRQWRDVLDMTLTHTEDEAIYRTASFKLGMAREMVQKRQFDAARAYADSVRDRLATLEEHHRQRRPLHESLVKQAQQWATRTVKESKEAGTKAIIVDKSSHRLYVLSSGKIIDSMTCELGYNSGHQKRVSGDGATPEGMYRVTKVNRHSKYYLALLLDYPNADDKKRFKANIEAGVIPANSKIGGLIEIHGHGGQGRDWTDGCVAVTNKEMEGLLRVAPVGTLVTIVRVWERNK